MKLTVYQKKAIGLYEGTSSQILALILIVSPAINMNPIDAVKVFNVFLKAVREERGR